MSNPLFEEVKQWIDKGAAPGGVVALLAPHAEQLRQFAYGHYAGSDSSLVAVDTTYDVASITKLFTTALVLQLHEQGRLSVYDKCALYLPNFRHSEICIIDLLTHRLGMDLSLAQFSAQFSDSESFRDALLALEPPKKPLNRIAYANIQLFYAGAIVERVTNQSLRAELHQLFDQLCLKHTYTGPDIADPHTATPPTEVVGDTVVQGITHDESSRRLGGIAGNAGVFSTAGDLAAFGKAWLDGRVISRETSEIVFRNYDTTGDSPQALGWWLRIKGADDKVILTPGVYSHVGFTGPLLAISPVTGKVCAFTCNRTMYGRDNKLQRHIWQALITWMQS